MIGHMRALLLAAVFLTQASQICAVPIADVGDPLENPAPADVEDSGFVKCMKGIYHDFPQANNLKASDTKKCHGQTRSKRDLTYLEPDLVPRDDTVNLENVICDAGANGPLTSNFMIVTDVDAQAQSICEQTTKDVAIGLASTVPILFPAYHKKLSHFQHAGEYVKLIATYANYNLPIPKNVGDTVQGKAVDVCVQAIKKLATKGQGCTRDLNHQDGGHGATTSTGARSGAIDIAFGAADNVVANIDISYEMPS